MRVDAGPAGEAGGQTDASLPVEEYLALWAAGSRAATNDLPAFLDVEYGEHPAERLDLFPSAQAAAPLVAFLHGGGWTLPQVSKEIHRFPAPAFVGEGIAFASIEYPLLPAARMSDIVSSVVRAMTFLRKASDRFGIDPDRIYLVGHSAGGHLVAVLLSLNWSDIEPGSRPAPFLGGCCISGIFELKNEWIATWNDFADFTPDEVRSHSPLFNLPAVAPSPLLLTAGGIDDPEFHRQMGEYSEAWAGAGWDVSILDLPGLHHMNEILELARRDSDLFKAIASCARSCPSGSEPEDMRHCDSDRLPLTASANGYECRSAEWGGVVVSAVRASAGSNVSTRLAGLSDDSRLRPRWGFLLKGRMLIKTRDQEQEIRAGQTYEAALGHLVELLEDCEMIEFTPRTV